MVLAVITNHNSSLERAPAVFCFYLMVDLGLEVSEEVYSIQKMGIKMEPIEVAETVWKAAHGKKQRWKVGGAANLLAFLVWLLPFLRRRLVKSLTFSQT